mmetsp:Transcript_40155/g.99391  ORF Transcript_40155/g.99391 Transcript_40155/m.99391 type:complete len:287 (-) Transcript_40155:397-1257(-)
MLRRALNQLAASARRTASATVTRPQAATHGLLVASRVRDFSSSASHATTVLCVRKDGEVVIIADGQVTAGSQIVKPNVKKVRRLQSGVIGGFAGATADAFTLFERLEMKLEEHPGQLTRAAVELAKAWRSDKYLRRLEATMVVADKDHTFQITGGGDVIESHDGVTGIGSGGPYAVAAARALIDVDGMDATAIAMKAMHIAADACVYTNHNFTTETLGGSAAVPAESVPAEPVVAAEPAVAAVAEKESEVMAAAAPPGNTSPKGGKEKGKGGDKVDKGAADGATGK